MQPAPGRSCHPTNAAVGRVGDTHMLKVVAIVEVEAIPPDICAAERKFFDRLDGADVLESGCDLAGQAPAGERAPLRRQDRGIDCLIAARQKFARLPRALRAPVRDGL